MNLESSEMEIRIAAREQADAILLNYPDMPKADAARMRTIITELIMYEQPIRQLKISIEDQGNEYYSVIVLGYRNVINDLRWINTFFGSARHDDLTAIEETETLFENSAKVLLIKKRRFVNSDTSKKRRFERRTD